MTRLTQKQLTRRIYDLMKHDWESKNTEEQVLEYEFFGGVRFEKTSLNGSFHPFYHTRRFDPCVAIYAEIKNRIKYDINYIRKHLDKGEFIVVNSQPIKK